MKSRRVTVANESELLKRLLDLIKDIEVETLCEVVEAAANLQRMRVVATTLGTDKFSVLYVGEATRFAKLSDEWDSNLNPPAE